MLFVSIHLDPFSANVKESDQFLELQIMPKWLPVKSDPRKPGYLEILILRKPGDQDEFEIIFLLEILRLLKFVAFKFMLNLSILTTIDFDCFMSVI